MESGIMYSNLTQIKEITLIQLLTLLALMD
jgi:hypothetical protein